MEKNSSKDLIHQAVKLPSSIPEILKQNISFDEDINGDLLLITQLLFGAVDPESEVEKTKNIKVSIGVCGQIVESYDILWFCKTCGIEPSSGLCQSCYENSVHTGHETFFRKGYIGVCDCGDPDAWLPSGFCKNHQGYDDKNITVDLLPSYLKQSAPVIFSFLGEELNRAVLNFEHPNLEIVGRDEKIIDKIVIYLSQTSELTAIFAKLICELMNSRMYSLKPKEHVCNFKTFLSEAEEAKHKIDYEKKVTEVKADICDCKLLENLLKIVHRMEKSTLGRFCEFIVKMVKSPLLKDVLGYGLLSNYKSIVMGASFSRIHDEEALEKVSLQIFSVDSLSYKYLSDSNSRKAILETIQELVEKCKFPLEEGDTYIQLFTLKRDLNYFGRERITRYLIDETDMVEKILANIATLEFTPLYLKDTTISPEELIAGPRVQPYFDHYWNIIVKRFLENIDYMNDSSCRKWGLLFSSLLEQQLLKVKNDSDINKGAMYHATQLHRLFFTFIGTLIHVRLASNYNQMGELRKEIRQILKSFLTQNGTDKELDQLIETTLAVSLTPLLFMLEVKNKEWNLYQGYLEGFAEFYYNRHPTTYFILDASLLQLLLGLYDGESKGFDLILKLQSNSKVVKLIQDINCIKVGDKNSNGILEGMLHLLCYLCSNNGILLLPLIRLYYPLATNREYLKAIKPIAEQARNYYFKKGIVQFAMNEPRFNYNNLFKSFPKKISKSKDLDGLLMEMCDHTKDNKGQVQFTLKPEKVHLFDPYYYPSGANISLSMDPSSQLFKRSPFDTIFGSMSLGEGNEKPPIELNKLFIERIMSESLIKFIIDIVKRKESSETIKLSAFKLLFTFTKFCNESKNTCNFLSDILDIKGSLLFEEIIKNTTVNNVQKYSFNRLAKELIVFQPVLAKYAAELEPAEVQKKSKIDIKENQRKIMEEFKKRQEKFASRLSQLGTLEETKESDKICYVCREKIDLAGERMVGKLIFAGKSMRLFQAIRQAQIGFEVIEPIVLKEKLDIPYVNQNGEGLKIKSCNHYVHVACLETFQEKESNMLSILFPNQLVDLFRHCPLCRSSYTWVIPYNISKYKVGSNDEEIKKVAEVVCRKIIHKSFKESDIELPLNISKELYEAEFYKKVFEIIQYNVQILNLTGIVKYLDLVEYLSSFLQCAKIHGSSYKLPELLKQDQTLLADRAKVLIDKLLVEYIESGSIELLAPEFVMEEIQREFKIHLYTAMLKLAKDKATDVNSLLSIGKSNTTEVIANSIKFIKMSIAVLCLFSRNGKEILPKVRTIFQNEDPSQLWQTLTSQQLPIDLNKALNDVLEGDMKEEVEVMLKNTPKDDIRVLELISKQLEIKFIELDKNYDDMILRFYQKNCYYCEKPFKEKVLCLCCGTVVCAEFLEHNKQLHKNCKGFTNHSKICQGSSSIYLKMSSGGIMVKFMALQKVMDSPYLTKFGEPMTVDKIQEEKFILNESALENLRRLYVDDQFSTIFTHLIHENV